MEAEAASASPTILSDEIDKLTQFGVGDTERVISVAFHPTKKFIVFGCENSSIKVWNVRSKLYTSIITHPGRIKVTRFSQDGTNLCTAASGHSEGNTIALWDCVHDVKNDEEMSLRINMYDNQLALGRAEVLHQGDINSVAFGPTRAKTGSVLLASGSNDCTVRLWHYPPGMKMNRQTIRNHGAPVTGVEFTDDGKYLLSASIDGEIYVYRLIDPFDEGFEGMFDDLEEGDNDGDDVVKDAVQAENKDRDDAGLEDDARVAPEFKFSFVYRYNCCEPVLDLKAFPGFEFVTQIGAQVSANGPDRQYILAVGGTRSVMLLRLHDGYIGTAPQNDLDGFLNAQGEQERNRTKYDDDKEFNYSIRKLNYSQLTLMHRFLTQEPVRSLQCAKIASARKLEANMEKKDEATNADLGRELRGYMFKKAKRTVLGRHMWNRRYFIANIVQGQIAWYQDESKVQDAPKGFVRFEYIKSVRARSSEPGRARFDIKLYGDDDPVSVRCESKVMRKRWMNIIEAGIDAAKPDSHVLCVATGETVKAYILQATQRPGKKLTPALTKAHSLVRAVYSHSATQIVKHDDVVTCIALPPPALCQQFVNSALLPVGGQLIASASLDQSVRLFKWGVEDVNQDGEEEQTEYGDTDPLQFKVTAPAPDEIKPWVVLERPLTQTQLTDRVRMDAAYKEAFAKQDVVIAPPRQVLIGHPYKPDVGHLGLTREKDLEEDSDSEGEYDPNDLADSGDEDETAYFNNYARNVLGPARSVEGHEAIVSAQVISPPKHESTAEAIFRRTESQRVNEYEAEDRGLENGTIVPAVQGQLASFGRMADRQVVQGNDRGACEVPGCAIA